MPGSTSRRSVRSAPVAKSPAKVRAPVRAAVVASIRPGEPIAPVNGPGARGKGETAYELLRDRILSLELPPGTLLREPEIMPMLGVGRTPLREAIQRLAIERMVVAHPRQTPYVAPILAQDLAEIVEMRLLLEVPAARLAAQRATDAERERLVTLSDEYDACHTKDGRGDGRAIVSANDAFHRAVTEMTRNKQLQEATSRLLDFSHRFWFASVTARDADVALVGSHRDIALAIRKGDPEKAARAAEEHVLLFQRRLQRFLGGAGPGPYTQPRSPR